MKMFNSMWRDTCALPEFPALTGENKTDVLIIGGGIAGLLTAYMLKKAGADCMVIEAERICSGITANTTAKITSQHGLVYSKLIKEFGSDTALGYYLANEAALEQYRKLCAEIDCDFESRDAYVYNLQRAEELTEEYSALESLNIPAEYVESTELPFNVAGAVCFKNQAQFHPLKFAAGISEGLKIFENTRAISVSGKKVLTNRGEINAENIVVATHFPFINRHGSYFLKMYQERSYVLAIEGDHGIRGMYLDTSDDGLSFREHNGKLLIGGGTHRTGETGGGWAAAESFAERYYPGAAVEYRWAAQDCMTLDGIPYIGRYSRNTPNIFVATGFNKWGMTSSMVAAELLRDEICGRKNPYAEIFSPQRTMLRPQLLKNSYEAVKNMATFSRPRCPHLGCALKWNPNEHSWDCPCHGSRFDPVGSLIDNPAKRSMRNTPR